MHQVRRANFLDNARLLLLVEQITTMAVHGWFVAIYFRRRSRDQMNFIAESQQFRDCLSANEAGATRNKNTLHFWKSGKFLSRADMDVTSSGQLIEKQGSSQRTPSAC